MSDRSVRSIWVGWILGCPRGPLEAKEAVHITQVLYENLVKLNNLKDSVLNTTTILHKSQSSIIFDKVFDQEVRLAKLW